MSDASVKALSSVTVFNKYSKFLKEENRRETWEEIIARNMVMHVNRFPNLADHIFNAYSFVMDKKVLPSMRSLQFGGDPISLSHNRMFNCAYLPINDRRAFHEVMFLLLGGTGVGYSVQRHHVDSLPVVQRPNGSARFVVQDSIIGWSDSVKALFKAYMEGSYRPEFDFRDVRKKGTPLKTSGGKAPGPEPLKLALEQCEKILMGNVGRKLTPLQVHDCVCYIADAVLSGGIRRAAMISLFDKDDKEMLGCKDGEWWVNHAVRARANNSAVMIRDQVNEAEFQALWSTISSNKSGEPGIFWTNDKDWGTNPCCEIALRPFQFCNLTTLDVSDVTSQEELNDRARAAAFIGTLQASYTDFHYLRSEWKETTESEALIGVSMTGIASGSVLGLDMDEAARVVKEENARVAKILGIRPAARTTCVKPEGTTSLVVGSSSGVHAWHSPYYVRRMRINKQDALYRYLVNVVPELIEDDVMKPDIDAVLSVPIKSPEGAVFRDESALEFLERVKLVTTKWIHSGHRSGENTHNVSATVSVRDEEWEAVGKWMWDNKDCYSGLSVLPYSDASYQQMPFEECSEETYNRLMQYVKDIDLTKVNEVEDSTALADNLACMGGFCEIK